MHTSDRNHHTKSEERYSSFMHFSLFPCVNLPDNKTIEMSMCSKMMFVSALCLTKLSEKVVLCLLYFTSMVMFFHFLYICFFGC